MMTLLQLKNFSDLRAKISNDNNIENSTEPTVLKSGVIYAVIVMASLVILMTVFGNLLVIVSVLCEKKLRKVGNAYIVSLAISDVLVGVLVSPVALKYKLIRSWTFGRVACDLWVSLDVICCTASIVNLCVISFDRYNAITNPLRYATKRTIKRALLFILGIWTYSALIAFPPFAGWNNNGTVSMSNRSDRNITICSVYLGFGYTMYSTIGSFYLPLVVMILLYGKIYRATRVRCKQWVTAPGYKHTVLSHRSSFVQKNRKFSLETQYKMIKSQKHFQFEINPYIGSRLRNYKNDEYFHRTGSLHILCDKTAVETDEVPCLPHRFSTISNRRALLSRMASLQSSSGITSETILSSGTVDVNLDHLDRANQCSKNNNLSVNKAQSNYSAVIALCRSLSPLVNTKTDDSLEDNESTEALNHSPTVIVPENRDTKLTNQKNKRKKRVSLAQEKRAARTLGIIMSGFVLCWTPFFVVTLINSVLDDPISPTVLDVVLWLGYFNSALNPFIYTFFNRDFRRAFRRMLCCLR